MGVWFVKYDSVYTSYSAFLFEVPSVVAAMVKLGDNSDIRRLEKSLFRIKNWLFSGINTDVFVQTDEDIEVDASFFNFPDIYTCIKCDFQHSDRLAFQVSSRKVVAF